MCVCALVGLFPYYVGITFGIYPYLWGPTGACEDLSIDPMWGNIVGGSGLVVEINGSQCNVPIKIALLDRPCMRECVCVSMCECVCLSGDQVNVLSSQ